MNLVYAIGNYYRMTALGRLETSTAQSGDGSSLLARCWHCDSQHIKQ
ncbi:MAG: hypothetical protein V4500_12530 [Pseudomonadota bacterium]